MTPTPDPQRLGQPFTVPSLTALCRAHNIPSLRDRIRTTGMLTLNEVAKDLGGVDPVTVLLERMASDHLFGSDR
jgi:hypothetical protein